MNVPEILERKRDGEETSDEDLAALLSGMLAGEIPDYQISAYLMAVVWRGMSARETASLTRLMRDSGDVLAWEDLPGIPIDKHSTGGVGDKISIPLAPAVAACGASIPMISGRGLGHTGGTLDKLESIPGLRTDLSTEKFRHVVRTHGFAIASASSRLAPADARLYALRDVTGTVPSVPLITASILSKKYAAGVEALVLDIKCGSGAFLRDAAAARTLAASLVGVSAHMGKRAVAVLTSMGQPLGRAVGNALEIRESMDVLEGRGPADVVELTVALGAEMLVLGSIASSTSQGRHLVEEAIRSGRARERFLQWVSAQGGDTRALENKDGLGAAPVCVPVPSPSAGTITAIETREIGLLANELGAGRLRVGEAVDPLVGVEVNVRLGDQVEAGQPLARVHARSEAAAARAVARFQKALVIEKGRRVTPPPLIQDVVRSD